MTSPLITARLRRATLSNSGWYLNQLIIFLTNGKRPAVSLPCCGCTGASEMSRLHTTTRMRTKPSTF